MSFFAVDFRQNNVRDANNSEIEPDQFDWLARFLHSVPSIFFAKNDGMKKL